ncbi:hypothetical protein [Ectopseudomonas hydrolytica]|uniref:hypothetical protein n=1 Tax=Ectopseudomonas hydrolytica TaxID=2493633 RepID=UPI003C2CF44A
MSMVILRVGDGPLALCKQYSKRRASLEKSLQATDLKVLFIELRKQRRTWRRGFAGSATAKRQAWLAALPPSANPPHIRSAQDVQRALINAG